MRFVRFPASAHDTDGNALRMRGRAGANRADSSEGCEGLYESRCAAHGANISGFCDGVTRICGESSCKVRGWLSRDERRKEILPGENRAEREPFA